MVKAGILPQKCTNCSSFFTPTGLPDSLPLLRALGDKKGSRTPEITRFAKLWSVTDCRVPQARVDQPQSGFENIRLIAGGFCLPQKKQLSDQPCFWRCVIGPRTGREYDFSSSAAMGEDRHQSAVGVCPYNPSSTNRRALFFSKVSKNASVQEPVLKTRLKPKFEG